MTTVSARTGWATWARVPWDQDPFTGISAAAWREFCLPTLPLCPWAVSEPAPQRQASPPSPSQTARITAQAWAESRDHEQGWRLQDKRRESRRDGGERGTWSSRQDWSLDEEAGPQVESEPGKEISEVIFMVGSAVWHLSWSVTILFI